MTHIEKSVPVGKSLVVILIFLNTVILKTAFIVNENWYWALVITVPLLVIASYTSRQKKVSKKVQQNYKQLSAINSEYIVA